VIIINEIEANGDDKRVINAADGRRQVLSITALMCVISLELKDCTLRISVYPRIFSGYFSIFSPKPVALEYEKLATQYRCKLIVTDVSTVCRMHGTRRLKAARVKSRFHYNTLMNIN